MSEIDINEAVDKITTAFEKWQGNMPPIREVKLNEDDLKLSYWQREAQCQKNWCEHYKQLSERYKQAIEEIKEIAEDNFYYLDSEKRWVLNKIIQKCEESNENQI